MIGRLLLNYLFSIIAREPRLILIRKNFYSLRIEFV